MSDTTFSIELQGLDLPYDVSSGLESELRSAVLAEIAKIDLGRGVTVEPLPESTERKIGGPILGFVVKNAGSAERDVAHSGPMLLEPSLLAPSPLFPDWLKPWLRPSPPPTVPMVPPTDALEYIYYRPDVRAACASNSKALAELLSTDEQAMLTFNELTGGAAATAAGTERIAPFVALAGVAVAGVAVGIAAGYVFNRPK